jgi:hypothetical protein
MVISKDIHIVEDEAMPLEALHPSVKHILLTNPHDVEPLIYLIY